MIQVNAFQWTSIELQNSSSIERHWINTVDSVEDESFSSRKVADFFKPMSSIFCLTVEWVQPDVYRKGKATNNWPKPDYVFDEDSSHRNFPLEINNPYRITLSTKMIKVIWSALADVLKGNFLVEEFHKRLLSRTLEPTPLELISNVDSAIRKRWCCNQGQSRRLSNKKVEQSKAIKHLIYVKLYLNDFISDGK